VTSKIGLISTINNSGLGQLAKQFHRMFKVHNHFVIPHPDKGTHLECVKSEYIVADQWDASMDANFNKFLSTKPDLVVFFEYPYNWRFLPKLKEAGIKIAWIPMVDSVGIPWLRKENAAELVDLYINPTKYGHDAFVQEGLPSIHLPWPIDTDYFAFKQRGLGKEIVLLHNVGRGGDGNRKGWDVLLKAWTQVPHKGVRLIVHSQIKINARLLVDVDFRFGDFKEASDLYAEGDIYVSPSRKEGLGLPFREAMSCGMPIIGTDIPPINEVVEDKDFLTRFSSHRPIGKVQNGFVYEPHLADLVDRMQLAVKCGNIKDRSLRARSRIESEFSVKELKPVYETVFEELVK
jgi:glycosyltransferase involved in cell wall biosynthesis